MDNQKEQLEALTEIRSMMERSSRFISLSGLSGVFAGIFALVGAALVYMHLHLGIISAWNYEAVMKMGETEFRDLFFFLLSVAVSVLVLSIGAGLLFTMRKAKKGNQPVWDSTAKRLLINMFIPLATGGLFCLTLLMHQIVGILPPAVLIFYGLACVNASKYTLEDIRYLGLTEIALGLVSLIFMEYSLLFWAIGFGVVHIVYGIVMYNKYEKQV